MKKEYLKPEIQVVPISTMSMVCVSPGAGDQVNPGLGGSPAPELFTEDDLFGNEDIKQLMP